MRITFFRFMALALVCASVALVAIGWLADARIYLMLGAAAGIVAAFLCVCMFYRNVRALLVRTDHMTSQLSKVQRSLERFDDVLSGQSALREDLSELGASLRLASRQADDAQALVLRAFRDLRADTKGLSVFMDHSAKLMRQVLRESSRDSASIQKLLVEMPAATDAVLKQPLEVARKEIGRVGKEIENNRKFVKSYLERDNKLRDIARRALGKIQYETIQDVESLLQLNAIFMPKQAMPLLGGYAMQPVSMLALVEEIRRRKPDVVVECGCGASTVWIAHAMELNGKGRLVSLEHSQEYFGKCASALREHGLMDRVELRLAPLEDVRLGEETFSWYATASINDLAAIDVLIVDGPPGWTGPQARYPAMPLLAGRLVDNALVIVDDADRPDEEAMLARWSGENARMGPTRTLAGRTLCFDMDAESATAPG